MGINEKSRQSTLSSENCFTARITELMQVLKDLNHGKYERTMVSQQDKGIEGAQASPLIPGAGEIINADNIIKFDHVPLATPNGDILIQDLSFEVRSGANVLICGPNGCGKSSLFRVLGEVLKGYLDNVQLGHILEREGGWDSVQDWMDVLSGGEKQRMAVGITLFTVSHRKSLWKHHEYYLHMDGRGNYEFKKITEDTVEFGS
ncbi:ATP-binding cassette, sub-family D (ALD), member 3, isoform CRA_c [Rattus norvegicus]|uniref:ATP-binding cassette, sub-family D (ALD), member 3, isoform CRA_c n=1 Tax=Rattus norvegicus TaxID=10116 RepID=A6HVF3_RAT|nr:ATP-binding cassette, sub-family D (ALD), member 3, isoform CRA_c [Rattus norvegicus]